LEPVGFLDQLQQHVVRHGPDTAALAGVQVVQVFQDYQWQVWLVHDPRLQSEEEASPP
jgi:hypothetical protein